MTFAESAERRNRETSGRTVARPGPRAGSSSPRPVLPLYQSVLFSSPRQNSHPAPLAVSVVPPLTAFGSLPPPLPPPLLAPSSKVEGPLTLRLVGRRPLVRLRGCGRGVATGSAFDRQPAVVSTGDRVERSSCSPKRSDFARRRTSCGCLSAVAICPRASLLLRQRL